MKKNSFKLFAFFLFAGALFTILQSLPSEGGRGKQRQGDPPTLSGGDESDGDGQEKKKNKKNKKNKKKQANTGNGEQKDEILAEKAPDQEDDDAAAVKKGATAASSESGDDDEDEEDTKKEATAADEPSEAGKEARQKKGLDIKLVDCGKEVTTVALAQECAQALLGKGKEVYKFLKKHESQHFGTAHDCEELSKEEDPKNLSKKRNPSKTFFYIKDHYHAGLEASLAQSQIVRCERSDKGNKEAFVCFLENAPLGCAPKQSNNVTVARMVINPKGTLVTLFPDYAEQKALGL